MNRNSVIEEVKALRKMIEGAKKMPFSRFASIDRDEALKRISRIENAMPQEMKQAFLIDKKREEILQDAYAKSKEIIENAKKERAEMLSESEIVKEAKKMREEIIESAQEEADSIVAEAENYAAKLLAKVENVLDRAKRVIQEGKEAFEENEDTTE